MGESSNKTVISQSIFSLTTDMGKLGCVIDLSQKGQSNSLASEFSKAVASLFATDNSKIVCLGESRSKKPFSVSSQNNFASDHSSGKFQGILNKNILTQTEPKKIFHI